jgi:acetyl esterase/lipase
MSNFDAQTISWIFFAVSIVGACFTLSAVVRGRKLFVFVIPYFFAAWLTSELALHHIVWQALATLAFVWLGALQHWPGVIGLGITIVSWLGLLYLQRRSGSAAAVFAEALRISLAEEKPPHAVVPLRQLARPFRMRRREVERIRNLPYGDAGKRHLLDVYRPRPGGERCPTLLQIHGGGWVIGRKDQQGLPLMHHLASRGWVCVAPNYRLSPKATFPDHLIDVKQAIAWVRLHGADFGADPDFIVVTGGSAGGHLAALTALTANDEALQPGFEKVDTSVAACVPFYGIYDFLERHGARGRASMRPFLEKVVMKCSPDRNRALWEKASPISLVHPGAPPFLVIHGTHDSLAFVEDARHFVARLREVSRNPVAYAELPGAQHAFETFHSLRGAHAINAVSRFVEIVHARHRAEKLSAA